MNKNLVLSAFLILIMVNYLKGADTIVLVPNPKIEIRFNYCPITFVKWNIPGYSEIFSAQNSPDDSRNKILTKSYTNIGIGCFYNIKKAFWVGLNAGYYTQLTSVWVKNETDPNFNKSFYLNIYQKVIQLNFNVSYRIQDNKMNKHGTFFTLSIAQEFANGESGWIMVIQDKAGNVLLKEKDYEISNKKHQFKRVTPSFSITRYRYNSKGNFSFNYGSSISFKSIIEPHKHPEYLKNYKIMPLILGISFHFK